MLKVCQVETLLGTKLCAHAGVDFIGLHAISPEKVSAEYADDLGHIRAFLTADIPHCQPVLVTLSSDVGFLASLCEKTGVNIVQLHQESAEIAFAHQLMGTCRNRPAIIRNVVINSTDDYEKVRMWANIAYAVLFDTNYKGGTGTTTDWNLVRGALAELHHGRGFVAGGLGPTNVRQALAVTAAWGADTQSAMEIRSKAAPHRKNVQRVVQMVAAVHDDPEEKISHQYRLQRARPRILFSPTEFELTMAQGALAALARSSIDGIQVDVADGTAGVHPWPLDAATWAAEIWHFLPEAPLWLHCFSKERVWIAEQVRLAQASNPHLVGVFVQDERTPEQSMELADALQAELGLTVAISIGVDRVADAQSLLSRRSLWQITTPSRNEGREERTAAAIEQIQRTGAWVNLDRKVSQSFLRGLRVRPNGATIGRALADSGTGMMGKAVDEVRVLLERAPGLAKA